MSKLTREQVVARYMMYEEAAEHLSQCVHMNESELEQSGIVQKQIRALQKRFYDQYHEIIDNSDDLIMLNKEDKTQQP